MNNLYKILSVATLLVVANSFALCQVEDDPNSNIPSFFHFPQNCSGNGTVVELQGVLDIDGAAAVEGEDFMAAFDSDGFIIGNEGVLELSAASSGCPTTISFFNLAVYGDARDGNDSDCPTGWGANESEVLTVLAYDGSRNLYFEVPLNYSFNSNDGIIAANSDDFCEPFDAAVLPVQLSYFTGAATTPKIVSLTWQTAQESNSSHYEIERSFNGQIWEQIGSVAAVGESTEAVDYSFADFSAGARNNFYRLKMLDQDGSYEYSGIVIVELSNEGERAVNVFPNPATADSQLSIQLSGKWNESEAASALLFDAHGRKVAEYAQLRQGTTAVSLPSGTTPGLYLLRTTQGTTTIDQKVMIH